MGKKRSTRQPYGAGAVAPEGPGGWGRWTRPWSGQWGPGARPSGSAGSEVCTQNGSGSEVGPEPPASGSVALLGELLTGACTGGGGSSVAAVASGPVCGSMSNPHLSRPPDSAVLCLLENGKSWEPSAFPAVRGLCAPELQNVCDQRKPLENPFPRALADQLHHNKQASRRPRGSRAATAPGRLRGRDRKGQEGHNPSSRPPSPPAAHAHWPTAQGCWPPPTSGRCPIP